MLHIMLRSLDIAREEAQAAKFKNANPDIIIKPYLENISLLQFDKVNEALAAGEKAAEEIMPQLLELICKKEATKS